MCADGTSHVALLSELHAARQLRRCVAPERRDLVAQRVLEGRPPGPELRVPRHGPFGVRGTPERAIREREPVVGGAELWKERDGAVEVRDRPGVIARRGVEPAEAKLGCRRSTPIADERLEQSTAVVERASFEGRFCEADPGGQIR